MIHNVNASNNWGFTALMLAAKNNHLGMVISLMNQPGIDLNVQSIGYYMRFTALHHAVHFNHPAILAQLLSDDRIDCSLKANYNTTTPLSAAILRGYDECVKILREHGAPEE